MVKKIMWIDERRAALFLFLFFLSFYAFFSIGHFGGDGYQDYLTAESMILDGNLSLYDRPSDPDDLKYDTEVGTKGIDGRIYSSRMAVGISLILAPFYALGHFVSFLLYKSPHDYVTMLFVSFANPFLTALACLFVFLVGKRLKFGIRESLLLAFCYGLATIAPVYARSGFSEPAVCFFMLAALYAVLGYASSPSAGRVALSAFLLGCEIICKPASVIFVPCFFVYLAWFFVSGRYSVARWLSHLVVFAAVISSFILGVLCLNKTIYGSAFSFGSVEAASIGERIGTAPHLLKGIYYYLFSTGKSFFLFNIPVLLAFFAMRSSFRKARREAVLLFLIFAVNVLFYAKSFRRGSLFSWGPRYLLPSVPVMVLLVGYYLEEAKSLAARTVFLFFSVLGFFVVLPCLFVNPSRFYFFVVEKLGLEEYMINFIPDLSPIKGAWSLFISHLFPNTAGGTWFVYMPDYRLVQPISASMAGYNYFDIWFLKVLSVSPNLWFIVSVFLVLATFTAAFSFSRLMKAK